MRVAFIYLNDSANTIVMYIVIRFLVRSETSSRRLIFLGDYLLLIIHFSLFDGDKLCSKKLFTFVTTDIHSIDYLGLYNFIKCRSALPASVKHDFLFCYISFFFASVDRVFLTINQIFLTVCHRFQSAMRFDIFSALVYTCSVYVRRAAG